MNDWPEIPTSKILLFLLVASCYAGLISPAFSLAEQVMSPPLYVGSKSCQPCHQKEYASFIQYAKKSKSYQSIERLKQSLSEEDLKKCYSCHTTGYGKPGGFTSVEETPELKNAGCEVCHGPGGRHVETEETDSIRRQVTREVCEGCHISERVRAFRYKPLIHGGGH